MRDKVEGQGGGTSRVEIKREERKKGEWREGTLENLLEEDGIITLKGLENVMV